MQNLTLAGLLVAHPEFADEIRWFLELADRQGADSDMAKERGERLDRLAARLGVVINQAEGNGER